MATIKEMKQNLAAFKTNSAYNKGIKECAEHLMYQLNEAKDYKNIKPDTDVKDILHTIQGCETWTDYSHGGCFCIMDAEVAEMCCTPSELKNYHYNSETKYVDEHHGDMDWLDVQAVMLYQAEKVLLGRFVTKNMPDRRTSNYATRK